MKKTFIISAIALLLLCTAFGSLYVIDHQRMENNEPVIFSTWGKEYTPSSDITRQEAIEIAKSKLDKKAVETITNFENPVVEEVIFDTNPSIYLFEENANIIGKPLYKITFNTTQDGLLGPIVFYVDKNGNLIGADYRE